MDGRRTRGPVRRQVFSGRKPIEGPPYLESLGLITIRTSNTKKKKTEVVSLMNEKKTRNLTVGNISSCVSLPCKPF